MSVSEVVRSWTDEHTGDEEMFEHPAGELDAELEQLCTLESLVRHAYASCTNSAVACSGALCCL